MMKYLNRSFRKQYYLWCILLFSTPFHSTPLKIYQSPPYIDTKTH